VTTVRVARADPRNVWQPDGMVVVGEFLVVLTDENASRALPLWLQVPGGGSLSRLLDRPGTEPVMAGVPEEAVARLLDAAGVPVAAVYLDVTTEDAAVLRSDTVAARVELATADGTRQVNVSAGYGLALAVASGAAVRVADAVMDRLAVPVSGDDPLEPLLPPEAARGRGASRWRFEPRNLTFSDGLDRWQLAGSFLAVQADRQDYSATAEDGRVALASSVSEPHGFAVLVQTIFADDYNGRTITFRAELRTQDLADHAGLHLAAGHPREPPGAHLRNRGAGSRTTPGSSDWARHEVTMQVPGDATIIRFGVSLSGRGRVEMRNAELAPES
jgi:hypothetical protein